MRSKKQDQTAGESRPTRDLVARCYLTSYNEVGLRDFPGHCGNCPKELVVRRHAVSTLLLSLGLASGTLAATAVNTFNVGITLNSSCEVMTVPTIAFNYTSFQPNNLTPASSFNIRCTATKSITSVRLDDGAGNISAGASQTYTDVATGLVYTLALTNVPTAGATGGAAMTVNVTGTMLAGQAGICNAATCDNSGSANKTRTITITY